MVSEVMVSELITSELTVSERIWSELLAAPPRHALPPASFSNCFANAV